MNNVCQIYVGALMVMVASDWCKEDVGDCSNDCNNKCVSAHQGGQGVCGPSLGGQERCWCYYDCPPLKTCDEWFQLDFGCEAQSCDIACASKHPGQGAQGSCQLKYPEQDVLCHCTYFCSASARKFLP